MIEEARVVHGGLAGTEEGRKEGMADEKKKKKEKILWVFLFIVGVTSLPTPFYGITKRDCVPLRAVVPLWWSFYGKHVLPPWGVGIEQNRNKKQKQKRKKLKNQKPK